MPSANTGIGERDYLTVFLAVPVQEQRMGVHALSYEADNDRLMEESVTSINVTRNVTHDTGHKRYVVRIWIHGPANIRNASQRYNRVDHDMGPDYL